ncbi:Guanylate cyclase [Seminavis robusta]|uniref:Guanylate cyclase n=1 Tax=Seminavis robusta TaxID=568900 RepID=A0A9N8HR74_9STRA|nr:Guanylate cyclase [Seminavis robusta]|eukprot:Sro1051_g235630.1 Guanylate cyclase (626) ;mRNA; f:2311-4188
MTAKSHHHQKRKKSKHHAPASSITTFEEVDDSSVNGESKGQKVVSVLEYLFPVVAGLCLWRSVSTGKESSPWSTLLLGRSQRLALDDDIINWTTLLPEPQSSDLEEALGSYSASLCRFVMSQSMVPGGSSSAGWGIFSLVDIEPQDKLLYGDMRIQLVDVQNHQYEGLAHLLYNYTWKAKYGTVEGTEVQTVVPGMSMLSNSGWDHHFQAMAGKPTPPEPGTDGTRGSPTAGSFTHYHNRQYFAIQTVPKGQEILVNYGQNFVGEKLAHATTDGAAPLTLASLQKPVSELQTNGMCLDNIASAEAPGRGGRGAFATRDLLKGTVVVPLPLIPLNRTSLDMYTDSRYPNAKKQLLLNYCYGHENSTLLLFPYSPVVNYINSVGKDEPTNAVLRWSAQAQNLEQSLQDSAQDILASRRWGLLLEVVATRDISQGEQILIDYGQTWHDAWTRHVQQFQPDNDCSRSPPYVYASRLNQLKMVRTQDEQAQNPYPDNVETFCVYQYSETIQYNPWPHHQHGSKKDTCRKVTHEACPPHTRMVPDYLRPCRVLDRKEGDAFYTVEVLNDDKGSVDAGSIPWGERHIVTGMPRNAICFLDKVYSTDQNLASAFRHEIGLPGGVFPTAWMDLE